jgi:hypothetical protein
MAGQGNGECGAGNRSLNLLSYGLHPVSRRKSYRKEPSSAVRWCLRKAFGGKVQYRSDFFSSHVEDFADLSDGHPGFEIFEDGLNGHAVPQKTHAPLTLPGMLSTAEHCDQSRVDILESSMTS